MLTVIHVFIPVIQKDFNQYFILSNNILNTKIVISILLSDQCVLVLYLGSCISVYLVVVTIQRPILIKKKLQFV